MAFTFLLTTTFSFRNSRTMASRICRFGRLTHEEVFSCFMTSLHASPLLHRPFSKIKRCRLWFCWDGGAVNSIRRPGGRDSQRPRTSRMFR